MGLYDTVHVKGSHGRTCSEGHDLTEVGWQTKRSRLRHGLLDLGRQLVGLARAAGVEVSVYAE